MRQKPEQKGTKLAYSECRIYKMMSNINGRFHALLSTIIYEKEVEEEEEKCESDFSNRLKNSDYTISNLL